MTNISNTKSFVIKIDFTGICRMKAGKVMAEALGHTWDDLEHGYHHESETLRMEDGRVWRIIYNENVEAQEYENYQLVDAGCGLSNQLVTPILDNNKGFIELMRVKLALIEAGAFANGTCYTTEISCKEDGSKSTLRMPTTQCYGWDKYIVNGEPAKNIEEFVEE